jgi:hypothetical protein
VDCSGSHSGSEEAGPIITLRKRPRDPAELAKLMIDIASGEVEDRSSTKKRRRLSKGRNDGSHPGSSPGRNSCLSRFDTTFSVFEKGSVTIFVSLERRQISFALFTMYYNFVRIHKTLRTTPAMAAGVTDRLWEIGGIVDVLDAWEESNARNIVS